jgi:hypothetical protein
MLKPKPVYRFLFVVLIAVFTFAACNNKGEKKKESTEEKMDTADTKPTKDGD